MYIYIYVYIYIYIYVRTEAGTLLSCSWRRGSPPRHITGLKKTAAQLVYLNNMRRKVIILDASKINRR